MIKLFLQLVVIHRVLCAPAWIPAAVYGPPAETNLAEKNPPFEEFGFVSSTGVEDLPGTRNLVAQSQLPLDLPGTRNLIAQSQLPLDLPGTRNLVAQSQLPLNLPGTRNLDEKLIPDSISLGDIPAPSGYLELPLYEYDGGFLRGLEQLDTPSSAPLVQNLEPENEQGYSYHPPEYQPEAPRYPDAIPDQQSGSEIKGTEIYTSSNSPQGAFQAPSSTHEESNSGSELLSTFVQPASKPVENSGAVGSVDIPPNSSINVQDIKGQYSHGFANADGTEVQESGHLISTDDGWEYVIAKKGSYRYRSPEGIVIRVEYIADENGYRILSQTFEGR